MSTQVFDEIQAAPASAAAPCSADVHCMDAERFKAEYEAVQKELCEVQKRFSELVMRQAEFAYHLVYCQ